MNELARYLLQNAILDFAGDLSTEKVREFLRDEDSRQARTLLAKIIEDRGIDEMLIAVADCLKEQLPAALGSDVVQQSLVDYGDS